MIARAKLLRCHPRNLVQAMLLAAAHFLAMPWAGAAETLRLEIRRHGQEQRIVAVHGPAGAAGIAAHLLRRAAEFDADLADPGCASASFDQHQDWLAGGWLAISEHRYSACNGRQYAEDRQWIYDLESGAAQRVQDWLDARSWQAGRPIGTFREALREAVLASESADCSEMVEKVEWAEVRLSLREDGLWFGLPDWRPPGFCDGFRLSLRVLGAHLAEHRRADFESLLAAWRH